MTSSILVIDVGTSGLRAAIVRPAASVDAPNYRSFRPTTPAPGLVEFDATEMARLVLEVAHLALAQGGPVSGVGITTQRASTIIWDRNTGVPIGPGLGWQDLRTVIECIMAKAEHGLALAPNQTATKAAWILKTYVGDAAAIAERARDLCIGTVERACSVLGIPVSMLPSLVPSSGVIGIANALPGSPPIAAIAGDQQASLMGQSCVRTNMAKCTFGTGGMMNLCLDDAQPASSLRTVHGTFPIIAWSRQQKDSTPSVTWGAEAIMLSAGTNIDWLREDMGLISTPEESHTIAAQCDSSEGVFYVPALLGLGTPHWDYGARGALLGLTRGSNRSHVVRSVLEGIAHRGADLLESIEADYPLSQVQELRIDGGMSTNPTFVQALADSTGRPVSVSPVAEATTLGAAYLAGLAVGTWSDLSDIEALWTPKSNVEPRSHFDRASVRGQWKEAVTRAAGWITELSSLDF